MDVRQSPNYSNYMRSLNWQVERAGGATVFIRHIPLPIFSRWSVIKVQRFTKIDFEKLDEIAKKHHALFVKLEPDFHTEYRIPNTGYKKDSWPLLPTKTLVLDLDSFSLDSLPKDTRYEIRKAEKNNLTFKESTDLELFYRLLQETMEIGHWSVPIHKEVANIWQRFQPSSSLLLIAHSQSESHKQEDLLQRPLGGAILIWHRSTAHYMYAANTKKGRNLGAAYLTLWEAIKLCQKKGLRYLDLEGIHDERYPSQTENWQGFTKFKMGWGGETMEYPGSWTKYYNLPSKLLFNALNFIN